MGSGDLAVNGSLSKGSDLSHLEEIWFDIVSRCKWRISVATLVLSPRIAAAVNCHISFFS